MKLGIPFTLNISTSGRAREIFKKEQNDLHQKIYKMSAIGLL